MGVDMSMSESEVKHPDTVVVSDRRPVLYTDKGVPLVRMIGFGPDLQNITAEKLAEWVYGPSATQHRKPGGDAHD